MVFTRGKKKLKLVLLDNILTAGVDSLQEDKGQAVLSMSAHLLSEPGFEGKAGVAAGGSPLSRPWLYPSHWSS